MPQITTPQQQVRVWSVDDHPITGCALEGIFEQAGFHAEFTSYISPAQAKAALKSQPVDLVIVDLLYPDACGVDLILHITQAYPQVTTMVYTARDDTAYIQSCFKAGARGYLTKGQPLPALIHAIQAVLGGETYLDEALASKVTDIQKSTDPSDRWADLSRREREVLVLIGQGLKTPEIARKLCRSVKTIETYRARLKKKLEVENATQLAQAAWLLSHELSQQRG